MEISAKPPPMLGQEGREHGLTEEALVRRLDDAARLRPSALQPAAGRYWVDDWSSKVRKLSMSRRHLALCDKPTRDRDQLTKHGTLDIISPPPAALQALAPYECGLPRSVNALLKPTSQCGSLSGCDACCRGRVCQCVCSPRCVQPPLAAERSFSSPPRLTATRPVPDPDSNTAPVQHRTPSWNVEWAKLSDCPVAVRGRRQRGTSPGDEEHNPPQNKKSGPKRMHSTSSTLEGHRHRSPADGFPHKRLSLRLVNRGDEPERVDPPDEASRHPRAQSRCTVSNKPAKDNGASSPKRKRFRILNKRDKSKPSAYPDDDEDLTMVLDKAPSKRKHELVARLMRLKKCGWKPKPIRAGAATSSPLTSHSRPPTPTALVLDAFSKRAEITVDAFLATLAKIPPAAQKTFADIQLQFAPALDHIDVQALRDMSFDEKAKLLSGMDLDLDVHPRGERDIALLELYIGEGWAADMARNPETYPPLVYQRLYCFARDKVDA
ncbi:hypothetical protein PSPO01_15367 [Paraphaeosphaeria sporulosa]